jgi:hypothetical protein
MKTRTLLFAALFSLTACKNTSSVKRESKNPDAAQSSSVTLASYQLAAKNFADGAYCSQVEYYNPNTGTRNEYELRVDVHDNAVVKINWPNGGWLDESHFEPAGINEEGEASFTTDAGNKYAVKVNEGGPCPGTGEVIWAGDCDCFLLKINEWYVVAGRVWPTSKVLLGDLFLCNSWNPDNMKIIDKNTHEQQIWTVWMKTNEEKTAYAEIKKRCNGTKNGN